MAPSDPLYPPKVYLCQHSALQAGFYSKAALGAGGMFLVCCGRNPRAPRVQGTQKLALPTLLAAKELKGHRAVDHIPSGFGSEPGPGCWYTR